MSLFERIADFENLRRAYLGARKRKHYRSSILKFGYKLEENLLALRRELIRKTYRHGGYREFVVTDSKKRIIKAAPFRDRVVHHAFCNIIELILDRGFVYDSYACRRGKGTHAAVRRLESFLRSLCGVVRESNPALRVHCLKCDIVKYFNNVNHEILLELLQEKIRDKDVLWLCREIIHSNPRGIPIGNLTSQLFANVYLNELDHFVKRELHEKYYLRYMDDFLVLGVDKKRLRENKKRIETFLRDKLKLALHPKKAEVFPIDRGVDFLGYVIRDNRRLLRKSTVKRFLKKRKCYVKLLEEGKMSRETIRNIRNSWRGYAKFAGSYRLMKKLGL